MSKYQKTLKGKDVSHPVITKSVGEHLVRSITRKESSQIAAATLTTGHVMRAAGSIVSARALAGGVVPGAGESMTFDVHINGVTALTGVVTADAASGQDSWIEGVLAAARHFARGDILTIIRTYVAGGTPAPMTGTLVEVDVEYS